jgi:hypothetical protein
MQEVVTLSQHLSIMLDPLATGKGYKHLTFINATSSQSIGDMRAWLIVTKLIIREYCSQTIQYIAPLRCLLIDIHFAALQYHN